MDRILFTVSYLVVLTSSSGTTAFLFPSGYGPAAIPTQSRSPTNRILPAKQIYSRNAQPSRLLQNPTTEHDDRLFRSRLVSFRRRLGSSKSKLSAVSSTAVAELTNPEKKTLDTFLSRMTSAFPFFVLGSAILGLTQPSCLMWTNRGTLISWMLASVMCATGLTLEKKDFTKVLRQDFKAVPAGVLCQFIIMPLGAFLVGKKLLLTSGTYGTSLYLGLCLVGCSPGGTASNLVSLIAKADVALSVLLTSCSTILASIVTPLLVKLLVGSAIEVSGWALCEATARVVLFPVMFGMFVNAKAPNLAQRVSRFTPFASVLLVSLICGGVVALNSAMFLASRTLIPLIVGSVLSLHCLGFLVGYFIPRWGLGFSEMTSRTISIETGMQNSALAVVLARSIGAPAVASLPGALSATVHSCLGSILAGYWHSRQNFDEKNKDTVSDAQPLMSKALVEEPATIDVVVVEDKNEVVAVVEKTKETTASIESEGEEKSSNDEVEDEPPNTNLTAVVEDESAAGDLSESDKLLKQIKDSGVAGIIAYAAWELAFWAISVPVCLFGYYEVAGHWPDLSDQDDLAKLGAEAFAFVNFARFAVPLRIGLAFGTIPWIQDNIVDRFLKNETDAGNSNNESES